MDRIALAGLLALTIGCAEAAGGRSQSQGRVPEADGGSAGKDGSGGTGGSGGANPCPGYSELECHDLVPNPAGPGICAHSPQPLWTECELTTDCQDAGAGGSGGYVGVCDQNRHCSCCRWPCEIDD